MDSILKDNPATYLTCSLNDEQCKIISSIYVLPRVLVATAVAARGQDIRALPCVVNHDFPGRLEIYIHRFGRTGRLAAHGHS